MRKIRFFEGSARNFIYTNNKVDKIGISTEPATLEVGSVGIGTWFLQTYDHWGKTVVGIGTEWGVPKQVPMGIGGTAIEGVKPDADIALSASESAQPVIYFNFTGWTTGRSVIFSAFDDFRVVHVYNDTSQTITFEISGGVGSTTVESNYGGALVGVDNSLFNIANINN